MKGIYLFTVIAIALFACGGEQQQDSSSEGQVKDAQDRIKHTETYENGQVRVDGWEEGEKRVGLWVSYYENGVRWSEDEYRDGMKDGQTISYYPNGIIRYRGWYIENKKAGIWQFYDDSGKLVEEKDFNK